MPHLFECPFHRRLRIVRLVHPGRPEFLPGESFSKVGTST